MRESPVNGIGLWICR